MSDDLVKAPLHRSLAPVKDVNDARRQLERARARLSRRIDAVEHTMHPFTKIKDVFHKHPLACVGGAFLVGYTLARLFAPPSPRSGRTPPR